MKKNILSLALALVMCLALAAPAWAVEPSGDEGSGIVPPKAATITKMTAQEEPVLEAGGWWVKRVYCESGATLSLKASYLDSETQKEIAIGSANIYKVDSIEVFYIEPYLCVNIEQEDTDKSLKPGDSAFALADGEWLIEVVMPVEDPVDYPVEYPVEYIYVNVGGSPAPAVSFTDVPAGAWYADAVRWAVDKSITNGTSANTFSPEKVCTRGEVITFLHRAAGRQVAGWRPGLPSDAGEDEFYSVPVKWAAVGGLFSGDKFSPNAPCTRAMVADFLWRYAGSPTAAPSGQFTDVPAGGDLAKAVAWALENGVTTGTSATTFSPSSVCTRGEIVTFLYRALAE